MEQIIRKIIRNILSENYFGEDSEAFLKKYAGEKSRGKIDKKTWNTMSDEEKEQLQNYDFYKKEAQIKGDKMVKIILDKGINPNFNLNLKASNSHLFDYIVEKLVETVRNYNIDGQKEVILNMGKKEGGEIIVPLDDRMIKNAVDALENAFTIRTPRDFLVLTAGGTKESLPPDENERNEILSFINRTRIFGQMTKGAGRGLRRMLYYIAKYKPSPTSSFSALMKKVYTSGKQSYYDAKSYEPQQAVSLSQTRGGDGKKTVGDTVTKGVEFSSKRTKEQEVENYLNQFALTALKTFKKALDSSALDAFKTELLLQRIFEQKKASEITSEAIQSIKSGKPNEIGKYIKNKIENLIADDSTDKSFDELLESPEIENMINLVLKDTFHNFFKTKIIKDSLRSVLNSYGFRAPVTDYVVEYFFLLLTASAQTSKVSRDKMVKSAESMFLKPKKPLELMSAFKEGKLINDQIEAGEIDRRLTPEENEKYQIYLKYAPKGPNKAELRLNQSLIQNYEKDIKTYQSISQDTRKELIDYLLEYQDSKFSEVLPDKYLNSMVDQIVASHRGGEEFEFPETISAASAAADTELPTQIEPETDKLKEPEEKDWEAELADIGDPDAFIGAGAEDVPDEYEDELYEGEINEAGIGSGQDEIDIELQKMANDSLASLKKMLQERKIVNGIIKIIKEKIK